MNLLDVLFSNIKNNRLFLFSEELINKILNGIYIKDQVLRDSVVVTNNDITLINLMINYLSIYEGNKLSEDFYNRFMSLCNDKDIKFYIYFIFLYMKWTRDSNLFTDRFINNINDVFYSNDIESYFNSEKYRLHYSSSKYDNLGLDKDLSLDLVNYVKNNLPSSLVTNIEKAIGIYILLSKLFTYSPLYTVNEELEETTPFNEVNLEKRDVVCVQFSVIYHKLLSMYGIESNLGGDADTHMYVNLNFGNMMIRADATRYGIYEDKFNLSDMTNLKYDFLIEGFYILSRVYTDPYCSSNCNDRLNEIIINVYKKMNLPLDRKRKLNAYINRIQNKEFGIGKKVYKEDIDRRIEYLNVLPLIKDGKVEDTQFYNMLVLGIFFDIAEYRVENVSFYKKEDGKVILTKMLIVQDDNGKYFYYFFRNGKLVNYDVDTIVDIIINEGWMFKYQVQVEALNLDEERTLKLLRMQ